MDTKAVLADIDSVFAQHQSEATSPSAGKYATLHTLYAAAISRYAPPGSQYLVQMERAFTTTDPRERMAGTEKKTLLDNLHGILRALRSDYEAGRVRTFKERLHSEMFSDFLEMAEYLLADEGLKDPAAVLGGGVLEQHLRKLCAKHSITLSGQPKLDTMNADLAKQGAYGKNEQKQITAWAGIRNDAAHANYGKYTVEQVRLMIEGIRHFISSHPA